MKLPKGRTYIMSHEDLLRGESNMSKKTVVDKTVDPNETVAVDLPEGFQEVISTIDYPKWAFVKGQPITALVVAAANVSFDEDKPDVKTRVIVAEIEGERYTISAAAATRDFLESLEGGETIFMCYNGSRIVPGKPSPMKIYKCGVKS